MPQRIFIDTSVIGGYFDAEFKDYTKPLLEQINNSEIRIIYSEVTERELVTASDKVKELVRDLPKEVVDFVELTEEVIDLAHAYITERVVGKSSFDDIILWI